MGELNHYHPVLFSHELGAKPARVKLCGEEFVIFRTGDGRLGAFPEACPHRGMRLSEGRVENGRLVCPYHSWAFGPDGNGVCPATPSARPKAEALDVVEREGTIWLKRAGASAAFPTFDVQGWHFVARHRQRANAPLEIVLDNFIEVEHTPSVHTLLGHPVERMHEVECETTSTETSVRVYNVGPQKPLPPGVYSILQAEPGDYFVDDWTTYFSPVYTVYDQYWLDGKTREKRPNALRIGVFFVPVTAEQTDIVVLTYAVQPPWGRFGFNAIAFLLTRAFVAMEVRNDAKLLDKLADKRTELRGRTLGRFDKALGLTRKRIESIYRGSAASDAPKPGLVSASSLKR